MISMMISMIMMIIIIIVIGRWWYNDDKYYGAGYDDGGDDEAKIWAVRCYLPTFLAAKRWDHVLIKGWLIMWLCKATTLVSQEYCGFSNNRQIFFYSIVYLGYQHKNQICT